MIDHPLSVQRLALVDDALASHLNALFDEGTTWDAEQGHRFLESPDNLFVVARWDESVCGFATAHRLQRVDRRRAEVLLYEIGVHESFRRRGVGTALIAAVTGWAREVGADEVWVLTNTGNTAAMALYTATGGREDAPDITMFTYPVD